MHSLMIMHETHIEESIKAKEARLVQKFFWTKKRVRSEVIGMKMKTIIKSKIEELLS